MGEAMADQDIMHTADIMKAALPYIDAHNKVMVEFVMKIFDLLGNMKTLRNSLGLAACGYEAGKIDMEGLLNNIRPVCNKKERDIIDKILNIFSMKRAFEMYNKMMEAMNGMQDFGGFPFGTSSNFENNNPDMEAAHMEENDLNNDNSDNSNTDYHTASNDGINSASEENYHDASDDVKPHKDSSGSSGMMNDKMLDMLKAMVPPEQRATFENLSMLLNTMSYDNTSKPDESKEQTDNG
jgi:hypothetical protein